MKKFLIGLVAVSIHALTVAVAFIFGALGGAAAIVDDEELRVNFTDMWNDLMNS